MKRSFVLVGMISLGLILWPGCAAKKQGCAGCKTPCTCKKPCSHAAKATAEKPCHAARGSHTDFGEPMKLRDEDTLCLGRVLANPAKYDGQYVRVAGKFDSVCAKRGCRLRLAPCKGEGTLFVKFTCPIKDRLIPIEAVGKRAWVEGTLRVEEISQEEARHRKEQAGASREEIAKIVGPQKTVTMASPAARIAGL